MSYLVRIVVPADHPQNKSKVAYDREFPIIGEDVLHLVKAELAKINIVPTVRVAPTSHVWEVLADVFYHMTKEPS